MSLKTRFGHEENLSAAIARSPQFAQLLSLIDAVAVDAPALEKVVAQGHDEHAGRIDIFQPTTIGDIIVEVQYGRADNDHAKRLQNYANNFRSVAAVVFIAESFSTEMLLRFRTAKTPVYCVQAKATDEGFELVPLTAAGHVTKSQQARIKADEEKAQELIARMWVDCWTFDDGKPFGRQPYTDTETPSDLEYAIKKDIDKFLPACPKKTRHFLLTHPSFKPLKEAVKDEIAFNCFMNAAFSPFGFRDELPSGIFKGA